MTATADSMRAYCAQRTLSYERVYDKPERQAGLHAQLAPGAAVVMLDNLYVPGSNLPITRRDDVGNTYQTRVLDDGSTHEVLKNFPTREQAFAMLGVRACDPRWTEFQHYWALSYTLH